MATITTIDEGAINIVGGNIARVCGKLPSDPADRTYVHGATAKVLVTPEPPLQLLGRLGIAANFATLTRPNGSPVWVKGAAVSQVREPLASEITAPGEVRATVVVGGARQAVREDTAAAIALINAHGGGL